MKHGILFFAGIFIAIILFSFLKSTDYFVFQPQGYPPCAPRKAAECLIAHRLLSLRLALCSAFLAFGACMVQRHPQWWRWTLALFIALFFGSLPLINRFAFSHFTSTCFIEFPEYIAVLVSIICLILLPDFIHFIKSRHRKR